MMTSIQSRRSRCSNTLNGFMIQKSQLCVGLKIIIIHIVVHVQVSPFLLMCIASQAKIVVMSLSQHRHLSRNMIFSQV